MKKIPLWETKNVSGRIILKDAIKENKFKACGQFQQVEAETALSRSSATFSVV